MKRRDFFALIGVALVALQTSAQQARKVHRIGWPSALPREATAVWLAAFERGLGEHGYAVGKDVVIDFRHAGPSPEELAGVIRELVRDKVDVLVTGTNPVTLAAKSVAGDIPIVFAIGIDVIAQGFARTFAKPGGIAASMDALTPPSDSSKLSVKNRNVPSASLLMRSVHG